MSTHMAIVFTEPVSDQEICKHFQLDADDTRNRVHGLLEAKYTSEDGEKNILFGRGATEWSPISLATAVNFLLRVKEPQVISVRFLHEV